MEKKCFIRSKEGCIIEDSEVILLVASSILAVALSVPLFALIGQIPKR